MQRKINVAPDVRTLLQETASLLLEKISAVLRDRQTFSIALSGGNTPRGLYQLLATPALSKEVDWSRVEFYFGDERCVPPDSEQSNFRMADEAMLSVLAVSQIHIHRIRGEIDPETAAREYGELLKQKFGDGGMDLILLGMGDDGHTASLFPHTAALSETHHRCVANHVEKLNTWRITLTALFINRATDVLMLVAGADKSARLQEVLEGPKEPQRLPIQMIDPPNGTVTWMLDAAAAGMHAAEG